MLLPVKPPSSLLRCIAAASCLLVVSCGFSARRESANKGKEIFESISVPLGDTWVQKINGSNPDGDYAYFRQIKGLKDKVVSYPISEADKLNGLTWSGKFTWHAQAKRDIVIKRRSKALPAPEVEPWKQDDGLPCLDYRAEVVNGKWTVGDALREVDGTKERPTPEEMQMLAGLLK
jgi:hypothetical protein